MQDVNGGLARVLVLGERLFVAAVDGAAARPRDDTSAAASSSRANASREDFCTALT
jgi:hypothetical protein